MDPFRSWYNSSVPVQRSYYRTPDSFYRMPVQHVDPNRDSLHPAYKIQRRQEAEKPNQKVVSIPVKFLGSVSGSDRRSESAVKIQKVIRGFLVRNCLRKVIEVKSKVDEIEAELQRSEVVEKIRRNEKERLRMNESLMNLLLKLDGIRGVDLGVRVFRKNVTKSTIALQEIIDSIVVDDRNAEEKLAAEGTTGNFDMGEPEQNLSEFREQIGDRNADILIRDSETGSAAEKMAAFGCHADDSTAFGCHADDSTAGSFLIGGTEQNVGEFREQIVDAEVGKMEIERGEGEEEEESEADDVTDTEEPPAEPVESHRGNGEMLDNSGVEHLAMEDAINTDAEELPADELPESPHGNGPMLDNSSVEPEDAINADVVMLGTASEKMTTGEETRANKRLPMNVDFEEDEDDIVLNPENLRHKEEDDSNRDSDLLKKMTLENAKMMHMLTQLYDRNETQLQMLNTLANRVDYLEKAYLCDRLENRRKKKKKSAASAFCLEEKF